MRRLALFLLEAWLVAGAAVGASAQGFPSEDPALDAPSRIGDILAVDNSLSVSYELTRFDYGEPSNDCIFVGACPSTAKYLDLETGYRRGGKAALSYMGSLLGAGGDWYARASYRFIQGAAAYSGYGLPEPLPPAGLSSSLVSATSDDSVYDLSLRLGKGFSAGESWMFTPYVLGGYHHWLRKLDAGTSSSFDQIFSNGYIGGGEMVQVAALDRLVLTADASAAAQFRSSLAAEPSASYQALGYASRYIFDMEGGPLVDAGAEIDYRLWRKLHVFAGFDWSHASYRQSQIIAVGAGDYMQPESITTMASWSVGLRQSF